MYGMTGHEDYLALDDDALLAQCDVHVYRSSGPGGQHRNKVSSAVRLRHRPTGISAHGDDTRSQHANKRLAVGRLRMNLALRVRRPFDPVATPISPLIAECIFAPRTKTEPARRTKRMEIGRKDHRFWPIAALLLDMLDAYEGRLSDVAGHLGVSTSNLVAVLKSDRHLLGAAQSLRKAHGQKPVT
ncbi:MAG TPA: peptide chain release factor-like protein [Phycisphaerae bacterium]|nr:peptide chain release factor-like protein [Phycisphaerae bacterium]